MAQKLAVIETKSYSAMSDSALSNGFDRRLHDLARKFPESEERIADMTVKAQELLADEGISKRLTEIMDDINYMISSGELGITYAESAAMYVTIQSQ